MFVDENIIYEYEATQDSGFGFSLKKVAKRAVKAPKKVVKRTVSMVKESGSELKKGHLIKAGSTFVAPIVAGGLTVMNPALAVGAVARMSSDDKKKIDRMSLASPLAIGAINDRKLQKKAAIGWGAAAVVIGTAGLAGAGAGAGTAATEAAVPTATAAGAGTAAGAAGVGAGTLATVGSGVAIASTTVGLAEKTGLIKDKQGEEYEVVEQGPEETGKPKLNMAAIVTPQNVLLFVGLSALSFAGYMLFSKPKG